jgi:hypothetical protein
VRFKVGLDKNLDDLLASVNFDGYLYGLVVTCAPKATLRNVGCFKALCLRQSGTDGSNPVPSSRESANHLPQQQRSIGRRLILVHLGPPAMVSSFGSPQYLKKLQMLDMTPEHNEAHG